MKQKSVAVMGIAGMLAVLQMAPAATVTLAPGNGVETNVTARFTGATDLLVNSGATGGDMVALGSKHLVLRVTGTDDANAKFKAINCGQPCSLTASVEDGLVYVHVKSGGTVPLFR